MNFEDLVIRDTRANQPAAGTPGRLQYVTDEDVVERDNGSTWQTYSPGGQALIAARYNTAAGQSISNNTTTIVNFGTQVIDTDTAVTTGAAWVFTAPEDGTYAVNAALLFSSTTTWAVGEAGTLTLYKNGSIYCTLDRCDIHPASASFMHLGGSAIITLVAGDTINIRVAQVSGGSLALQGDATFNYVDIYRL